MQFMQFEILKLVCNRLDAAGIPYMLTGSFAGHFYLVPRMTRDIDIVVELLSSDVPRFCHSFEKDFNVPHSAIAEAIHHETMFNLFHEESVFKVDFIIRKNSAYREEEFKRRRRLQLNDLETWVVSPEDLVLSKLFWAKDSLSSLQLGDVKKLLASVKNLDRQYVEQWVKKLGLHQVYEKVQAHE